MTDVSYLGGVTSYKVKLDSGAIVRSSMANTARIDIDAYSRVSAWWRGSRPTTAWCCDNERAPHLHPPGAAGRDRALSVDGAVLPGAVRFRAEDQPVADRDRAAALSAGVRFHARVLAALRAAFAALSLDNFRLLVSDDLYVLSYLRSLVVAAVSTSILLADRLSHRLRHGAAAAALASRSR